MANNDEAERCIEIGLKKVQSGDFDAAKRLFEKSYRLNPTSKAEKLIIEISIRMRKSSTGQPSQDPSTPSSQPNSPSSTPSFTPKQQEIVETILKNEKDYYKLLGVSRDCTKSQVDQAKKKVCSTTLVYSTNGISKSEQKIPIIFFYIKN